MLWRQAYSISCIPILMFWLRSLSSKPQLRRPALSQRSTSAQFSMGGGEKATFLSAAVRYAMNEGAMHFATFSPALSGGFKRLIVAISAFLGGLRLPL